MYYSGWIWFVASRVSFIDADLGIRIAFFNAAKALVQYS